MLLSWGQGGGLNVGLSFWLPLDDAGAGAASTTPNVATGSGTATFTRATTAWTKLSTGLWASVASGTARSSYLGADTTVGLYGGFLSEQVSTNLCLQARDMTNASWTKTSITAAKDQAGIDGTASSASSLLATGANGTCLQTITQAATSATLSFFIKRLVGTGSIIIQQGATTSDITASVNAATYTRVTLNASVLNPAIGIKIVTSGDKIAVDMGQFENGIAFATSPIPTTTVSVARNADVLTVATSGNIDSTVGTAYAEVTAANNSGAFNPNQIVLQGAATEGAPMYFGFSTSNSLKIYDVTAERVLVLTSPPIASVLKSATTWSGSTSVGALAGVTATGAFNGSLNLGAALGVGNTASGASQPINGTVKNVRLWTRALTTGQLVSLTS